MAEFPPVPLTLEGSSVLHQFFRFDWKAWRALRGGERKEDRCRIHYRCLSGLSVSSDGKVQTASLFSQLGHKGDLILVHFRDSLEALNQVELDLAQTELYDFLDGDALVCFGCRAWPLRVEPQDVRGGCGEGSCEQFSPEWNAEVDASLKRGAEAMKTRLFPSVPETKYCASIPWIASAASR